MRYVPLVLAVAFAATVSVPLAAESSAPDAVALDRVAKSITTSGEAEPLKQTCPADYHNTRRNWYARLLGAPERWTQAACKKDMHGCADACLSAKDGKACYSIARLFEKHGAESHDLARRYAYALACSSGKASGCTNRAAGLRNAPRADNRLDLAAGDSLEKCLFRSFDGACSAGDAWGCAMAVQAYRLGEGIEASMLRARLKLNDACTLSSSEAGKETEAAPCRFARQQIKRLGDETD